MRGPAGETFRVQLVSTAAVSGEKSNASPVPRESMSGRRTGGDRFTGTEPIPAPEPGRALGAAPEKAGTDSAEAADAAAASSPPAGTRKAHERRVRAHLERYKYYPPSARRRGIEGEVELDFALDARGRARSVAVVAGSGYAVLDDAALRTVRRAEPFPVDGGEYRFRLRFSRL